jgi:endo-1,3(4)-beta-glucanase
MNNVPATPNGYIINGVVVDIRITAKEWKQEKPKQTITRWDLFGADINLSISAGSIEYPIARGASYITSKYKSLTPQFFTQHAIIQVEANESAKDTYTDRKFKVTFNNNPSSTYIIYVLGDPITLVKTDMNNLVATQPYNGIIQVAKLPNAESEAILDSHHGVWATGGKIKTNKDRYCFVCVC